MKEMKTVKGRSSQTVISLDFIWIELVLQIPNHLDLKNCQIWKEQSSVY